MESLVLNVVLVLVFIVIGGVFAGTELALVSLRESQIDQIAKSGARGERVARVARNPNRFLAAVQIGVTVAGFFSAAYGASTIAPSVVPLLLRLGLPEAASGTAALVLLTLLIAYASLVLGELVPKRLALQRASGLAVVVTPALDRFATLMRPVIWLLSLSTNALVRLFGGDPRKTGEEMSDEELRDLVIAHEGLPEQERQILRDVFEATEHTIGEVMRPRHEVTFLEAGLGIAEATAKVVAAPYSRFPVIDGDFDHVLGFVHVRDLLLADLVVHAGDDDAGAAPLVAAPLRAPATTVRELVRRIVVLPSTNALLPSMAMMRRERIHIAVVIDEYGGTDGIVTLEDLVEELVGEIDDEFDQARRAAPRGGLETVVEGGTNLEDFAARTGVELEDEGDYETVAGFVLDRLGRVAEAGDQVPLEGHVLEVVAVDGNRIERVRVSERPATVSDAAVGEAGSGPV